MNELAGSDVCTKCLLSANNEEIQFGISDERHDEAMTRLFSPACTDSDAIL